jgi:hypothetical protein
VHLSKLLREKLDKVRFHAPVGGLGCAWKRWKPACRKAIRCFGTGRGTGRTGPPDRYAGGAPGPR